MSKQQKYVFQSTNSFHKFQNGVSNFLIINHFKKQLVCCLKKLKKKLKLRQLN